MIMYVDRQGIASHSFIADWQTVRRCLIILPRSSKQMIVLASMMKMHVQLVSKEQRMVNADGQDVASHGYIAKC